MARKNGCRISECGERAKYIVIAAGWGLRTEGEGEGEGEASSRTCSTGAMEEP